VKTEFSIVGYSGHAYVVLNAALLSGMYCTGYFEKEPKENNPYQLNYLGQESDILAINKLRTNPFIIGIGNNAIRKSIYCFLEKHSISFNTIIHPKAIVANNIAINEASVVLAGVVINPLVKIGKGVICNSACIIEHECIIGDFSHIAPGAVLAGNVVVGNNTFIGANTVIKQGIKIGSNVLVGAGSVITKNIGDNEIVYGNPGKVIKNI